MQIGIIIRNSQMIDRGIMTGCKKHHPDFPNQHITICDKASAYEVKNERTYQVDETTNYVLLQQDENDEWVEVYNSIEKVDKTVYYDLPDWLSNSYSPIPNNIVEMVDGEVFITQKGWLK